MGQESAVLPSLDRPYHVTELEHSTFQRQGHVGLRKVATPEELAAFRPLIRAAALRESQETRPLEQRDTYGKAFLQVWNLWRLDPAAARFACAARFAGVAAALMGVPAVRMYHDQALFKEAGGGPTPWHQDQFYWPMDSPSTITMWMPLVDVPLEVGSMSFVDGSHQLGYLGEFAISDESEAAFNAMIDAKGLSVTSHGAMSAGDATFHAGWTLHSAPGNPTSDMREVMTVIYVADGARVSSPRNAAQRLDLERWLPGLEPGDVVASELNPLLWPGRP